jgi:uncharacterized protein
MSGAKNGDVLGAARTGRPWYDSLMETQDILARLRANEAALKARGVTHAALFGWRARGDNRPDSDIDLLVEIAPDAPMGV